jgi:hypothetical protein
LVIGMMLTHPLGYLSISTMFIADFSKGQSSVFPRHSHSNDGFWESGTPLEEVDAGYVTDREGLSRKTTTTR